MTGCLADVLLQDTGRQQRLHTADCDHSTVNYFDHHPPIITRGTRHHCRLRCMQQPCNCRTMKFTKHRV